MKRFLESVLARWVLHEAIEDFMDRRHEGETASYFAGFLGMSDAQYALHAGQRTTLYQIIRLGKYMQV